MNVWDESVWDEEPSQDWDFEPDMPDPDPMECESCGELRVCHFYFLDQLHLCDECDDAAEDVRQLMYGPPPDF